MSIHLIKTRDFARHIGAQWPITAIAAVAFWIVAIALVVAGAIAELSSGASLPWFLWSLVFSVVGVLAFVGAISATGSPFVTRHLPVSHALWTARWAVWAVIAVAFVVSKWGDAFAVFVAASLTVSAVMYFASRKHLSRWRAGDVITYEDQADRSFVVAELLETGPTGSMIRQIARQPRRPNSFAFRDLIASDDCREPCVKLKMATQELRDSRPRFLWHLDPK